MIEIYLNGNKIYQTSNTFKAIEKLRKLRKKYHHNFIEYICDDVEQNNFIFNNL